MPYTVRLANGTLLGPNTVFSHCNWMSGGAFWIGWETGLRAPLSVFNDNPAGVGLHGSYFQSYQQENHMVETEIDH